MLHIICMHTYAHIYNITLESVVCVCVCFNSISLLRFFFYSCPIYYINAQFFVFFFSQTRVFVYFGFISVDAKQTKAFGGHSQLFTVAVAAALLWASQLYNICVSLWRTNWAIYTHVRFSHSIHTHIHTDMCSVHSTGKTLDRKREMLLCVVHTNTDRTLTIRN